LAAELVAPVPQVPVQTRAIPSGSSLVA